MSKGPIKEVSLSHGEDNEPSKKQTMQEYWEWAKFGICSNSNVNSKRTKNLWESKVESEINQAIVLCEICPVKDICLSYAIENDEYENVWGGLTATERLQQYLREAS